MGWTIEVRPWDDPAGAELRRLQRVELDARYGTDDHEPGTPPSAADVDHFVVAVESGTGAAIGCGALRRLDATTAEIKRMFVVPGMRGTGVAVGLLRALEVAAAERGWRTLRLETGTEQPDAVRFYRREGYREIPLFGSYVGSAQSICFERELPRHDGSSSAGPVRTDRAEPATGTGNRRARDGVGRAPSSG